MRRRGFVRLGVWAAGLAVLLTLALSRLELSYDLGTFLPAPQTADQTILVERLGDAPGSRFIMLAVPDDAGRVLELVDALSALPTIERVLSDLAPVSLDPPAPVFEYRYLLTETDWSAAGLEAALRDRLAELGLGSDAALEQLIAADPALQSVGVLERLGPSTGRAWRLEDGRRVLVAVTRAAAFRIEAQAEAVGAVRAAVADVFPRDSLLSGAGVFGVALRDQIQAEALWRSLWATLAIATVLVVVYRRTDVLLLAGLPLAAGVVTGIAAVALTFGTMHGITLAFGFTLLGVAIDYPMHLLSRARRYPVTAALHATWPTLRLSALSTALAYGALMFGGAEGMTQLGLFSAAGVAGALLTTRYVLPDVITEPADIDAAPPLPAPRLGFGIVALVAGAAALFAWLGQGQAWWNSNLAALSPLPQEQLELEGALRAATGAPNIRYVVAHEAADLETVLQTAETIGAVLASSAERGSIAGFSDVTALLPSTAVQRARQARIPSGGALEANMALAVDPLPFAAAAFAPFVDAAVASRSLPPLTPDGYADSPLAPLLAQHLYQRDDGTWVALATLSGEPDVASLTATLAAGAPAATLIDLRGASEALVTDYRVRTLRVLAVVVLLIAGLLAARVAPRRALWAIATVVAAALFTAALLRWATGPLNLYHVTGLLLVFGICLDYALFLGKPDGDTTDHAVIACVLSTASTFAILGASSIPALGALGTAVAIGSVTGFGAAWLGSRGIPSRA